MKTFTEEELHTSFYDKTINIRVYSNGWNLEKDRIAGSPRELIEDEGTRKLIMLEANTLSGLTPVVQEFKVGDVVTFRAYSDQEIKAKVVKVAPPEGRGLLTNELPTYTLEGIEESLLSVTSPRSIKESVYFRCPIKYPYKS